MAIVGRERLVDFDGRRCGRACHWVGNQRLICGVGFYAREYGDKVENLPVADDCPQISEARPDLKRLAQRTRARWDLADFVTVSAQQWWRKLINRA